MTLSIKDIVSCLAGFAMACHPNALAQEPFLKPSKVGNVGRLLTVELEWSVGAEKQYVLEASDSPTGPWRFVGRLDGSDLRLEGRLSMTTVDNRKFYRIAEETEARPDPILEYAQIPAGSFVMGSPINEIGRERNERQFEVTLSRDFHMKRTEVTYGEFLEVMRWAMNRGLASVRFLLFSPTSMSLVNVHGAPKELIAFEAQHQMIRWDGTGLTLKEPGLENRPCAVVNWYGALAYCHFLSLREGIESAVNLDTWTQDFGSAGYRLPSEAEWEYACRAGTDTAFHSGPFDVAPLDNVSPNLDPVAWYFGNSDSIHRPFHAMPYDVGLKEPNAWGLFDMHGNVSEWVWDWWTNPYPVGPATDPTGIEASLERAIRGGAVQSQPRYTRSAQRASGDLGRGWILVGFRPARTILGLEQN